MPINPLLIKALKAKKCVLIIGHDAVLQPDNQTPIYQKALDEVSTLFPDNVFYQQGDDFMYIHLNYVMKSMTILQKFMKICLLPPFMNSWYNFHFLCSSILRQIVI